MSPKTLAEYKRYGIEFVLNDAVSYPTAKQAEKGKWKLNLPTKYEYPMQSVILRCFDEILKVETEYVKDIVLGDEGHQAKIAAGYFLTRRRAKIAARVFLTNMMLGEKCGWDIKGYGLAEKYQEDYNNGIRMDFEKENIKENTSRDVLMEIGNKYASTQLRNSIISRKDVPKIFPSMQPGSYFEELNIKEREIKHKNPISRFLAKEPVKLGSSEFNELMIDLNNRRKTGGNAKLNVVISPEKEIWVLPCYFLDGQKSQHSIVGRGNPCAWAGEVEIEGNKVISIKDQSGHYKTYDYYDEKQKAISHFALQTFRDQGFEVPLTVELTLKRR